MNEAQRIRKVVVELVETERQYVKVSRHSTAVRYNQPKYQKNNTNEMETRPMKCLQSSYLYFVQICLELSLTSNDIKKGRWFD